MTKSIINLAIRASNLLLRLILVLTIAAFYSPSEVAEYGLVTASLTYLLYLVGIDFFQYSNRLIAERGLANSVDIVTTHAVINFALWFTAILMLFIAKPYLTWTNSIFLLFIPLLFLECFNQEIARILVVQDAQILSSVLSFLRQGVWIAVLLPCYYFSLIEPSLFHLFMFWNVFGLIALSIGIYVLRLKRAAFSFDRFSTKLLILGVKRSLLFLVGTLAFRSIITVDRYLIEYFQDDIFLANYILAITLAATLLLFLDSVVFTFDFPKLLKLRKTVDLNMMMKIERSMFLKVTILSIFFIITTYTLLPLLMRVIDADTYSQVANLFLPLSFGFFMHGWSTVAHYGLYARGFDKHLVASQLMGLFLFILLAFTSPLSVMNCVVTSLCLSAGGKFLLYNYKRSQMSEAI